jgi:methylmalonyl-CoA/ethylmalonyl-CoA epimerase
MTSDIELDHIGIAVPKHDSNAIFWKVLGWDISKMPTEIVADQKVKVAFLETKNNARLELLEPTAQESTVSKFMEKRGPGIHHICLKVKNIDELLKNLKSSGIKLINETPVMGAHNCRVAFVHPSSTGGILVELSQKTGGVK